MALKHLVSPALSHKGYAANFTALLTFLFLKNELRSRRKWISYTTKM